MEENCFITFPSTYHVLQAEKFLKGQSLQFTLVPIPREITSNCGMAVMFQCKDRKLFEVILKSEKIEFEGFHSLKETSSSSLWQKLMR